MKNLAILLATYNGEKYVAQQIDSIIQQTECDWTLLVRDDGSTDGTCGILKERAEKDDRIALVTDDYGKTGSSVANFNLLALEALKQGFQYVFFADQDDCWLENKLSVQMKLFEKHLENRSDLPCLCYSDLEVVNNDLESVAPSFMSYQGLANIDVQPLNYLLAQNYVTGCGMAVNRKLLEFSLPIPEKVIMHDWWMAQCAAAIGDIVFTSDPLVKYRQHGDNVVGAKNYWRIVNPFASGIVRKWKKGQESLLNTIEQSKSLIERINDRFGCEYESAEKELARHYSLLRECNGLTKILILVKYGIRRQRFIMNLAYMLRMLFIPKLS